jgi:hypothetical protein
LIVHSHILSFLRATSGGQISRSSHDATSNAAGNDGGSSNGLGLGAFADPALGRSPRAADRGQERFRLRRL